nr:heme o synthase [Neochlamydia sp. EPS4]
MIIKTYYMLTKPGIIAGNAVTTFGGFMLASKGPFNFWLFCWTLIGLSLVIASACVFNNYMDREIDKKMARTKNRALVRGLVSEKSALIYGTLLGLLGMGVLALYANFLTAMIALAGFLFYVVVYGLWKYRSSYGTVIGSLAGGVPPVVGYCAVSNQLDLGAFLLFTIMVLWQMPHFFAITLYRLEDYAAASIPVLPLEKGIYTTKIQMWLYIMAFIVATVMLTFMGYTGYAYLTVAVLMGLMWYVLCLKGFKSDNDKQWARQMFLFSIVVIMVECFMMAIDRV